MYTNTNEQIATIVSVNNNFNCQNPRKIQLGIYSCVSLVAAAERCNT